MAYVAPNLTLKSVILAKSHTAGNFDVDPVPTAAANAMLLHTEVNPVQLDAERITPAYLTGSFTKQADIIGRKLWNINPQVYLQGSSDPTKAPFFLPLLEACGFGVTTTVGGPGADNEWTLAPLTEGARPCAIYHHTSGILKKMITCFGTVKFDFPAGQPANMTFSMKGLFESGGPTDVAYPSGSLVLPTPLARQVAKEGLTIGAYTPRFMSISLDMAGSVNERRDGNSTEAMYGTFIGDRGPTCVITIEKETSLSGFNAYAPLLTVGSFTDLSWVHGVAGGSRAAFTLPDWQLVTVNEREENRRQMWELTYKGRADTPDTEMEINLIEFEPV